MRTTQTITVTLALLLGVVGCDNTDADTDAGTDAGATGDAGADASTRVDSGPADPCAASMSSAISSLGCNGGYYGSTSTPNEIGGSCTPDGAEPPGPAGCAPVSGTQAACIPDEADPSTGTCLYVCMPAASYVSTGDCPTGSRCFTLDTDFAVCFRDCETSADCFADEECDGEGSCVGEPPVDGGVLDGGAPDGGDFDAGGFDAGGDFDAGISLDASLPDGALPIDAGSGI